MSAIPTTQLSFLPARQELCQPRVDPVSKKFDSCKTKTQRKVVPTPGLVAAKYNSGLPNQLAL